MGEIVTSHLYNIPIFNVIVKIQDVFNILFEVISEFREKLFKLQLG